MEKKIKIAILKRADGKKADYPCPWIIEGLPEKK